MWTFGICVVERPVSTTVFCSNSLGVVFFFQAEDGIRDVAVTGVQTCALPILTPVYAGDAPIKFDFLKDMRKGDILTLSVYSLGAHSGTHIDAPMHFVANGAPIDRKSVV